MTKKYKVNEVFASIQGEGPHVGTMSVFVRFSGCNLDCDFCDTEHEQHMHWSAKQVADEVEKCLEEVNGNDIPIILTGGEPLLQVDDELLGALYPHELHLETNGTLMAGCDLQRFWYIVVSPKEKRLHEATLGWANCLKVLSPLPADLTLEDIAVYSDCIEDLVVQPVTPKDGLDDMATWSDNLGQALADAGELSRMTGQRWRVIPQVHRLIGVR
jgi:organic radical activating enzyme